MMEKRGQVTIFIIIAILLIALGILVYIFFPGIKSVANPESQNPYNYFQECIEDKITETVERASLQGGSIHPDFYYEYQGDIIEYLCYTNEYYELCSVQQPLLLQHMQREILNEIEPEVNECFNSLEEVYKRRNYETNLKKGEDLISVEIVPEKTMINFDAEFTISKEESETYKSFNIVLNNDLYQMVSVANSIITWEATYGDVDTGTYMDFYQNLKVEKQKQIDGTTIYVLTNKKTEDKFQFASRSLVFAPGYVV